MTARLDRLRERIDALTLRERVFVLGAAIVVVVGLWEALLAAPLDARELAAAERIDATQQRIVELNRAIEMTATGITDGMPAKTERLRVLRERVAANEDSLQLLASDLVDPAQMRDVLEDLILERPGLDLVSIRNLPAEPMFETDASDAAAESAASGPNENKSGPRLYRHAVVIELEGSFLDALAYLREIEDLRWQLYWPRLELETAGYPRARIVVELNTLSVEEEWIGV